MSHTGPGHIQLTTEPDQNLVALLLAATFEQPEQFGVVRIREEHPSSPHVDTQSIFLVGPPWPLVPNVQDELRFVAWPALQWSRRFQQALDSLPRHLPDESIITRALVVKLKPGGVIHSHRDEGAYAQQTTRYHFPFFSGPLVRSTVGAEDIHMSTGHLWWFNHELEHSAINGEDFDRYHLIVDCWRK